MPPLIPRNTHARARRGIGKTRTRPLDAPGTPPLTYLRCVSLDLYVCSLLSAMIFVNLESPELVIEFIDKAISFS